MILRISGQITGQNVDTLRGALEQEGKTVAFDLRDVLLVDGEAVKLLALSEANGAKLKNCPAYVREWVARERAQRDADNGRNKGQKKRKSDDGI